MNLDHKYESVLCDLLSLLQQALLRLLTKKELNLNKFRHYFLAIYQQMGRMETQFHESKQKYTHYLQKLQPLLAQSAPARLPQQPRPADQSEVDQPPHKPVIRYHSSHKTVQHSRQLNSIEEEEEQQPAHPTPARKRSGTAGGVRTKISTLEPQPPRPHTGTTPNRAPHLNRTIQHPPHTHTQEFTQSHQTLSAREEEGRTQFERRGITTKRKSFYDELQKEKGKAGEEGLRTSEDFKLPFRKKHCLSHKKWTQKISRLL